MVVLTGLHCTSKSTINRLSERIDVPFGVHQGYNLGPVMLNLYGKDLTEVLPAELRFHQYAKDTSIYGHCKPAEMQLVLDIKLFIWLSQCNLALNPKKTKIMLLSTVRFSKTH